jgi:hypothetical protein
VLAKSVGRKQHTGESAGRDLVLQQGDAGEIYYGSRRHYNIPLLESHSPSLPPSSVVSNFPSTCRNRVAHPQGIVSKRFIKNVKVLLTFSDVEEPKYGSMSCPP